MNFRFLREVDSKRVLVQPNTPEKDGLIFIRPGVPEVSIGDRKYAQVRIVIKEFFSQGMAIYSEDIPEGYDIVVFTAMDFWDLMHHAGRKGAIKKLKTKDGRRTKVIDWNNPFGSQVERTYSIEEGSNVYCVEMDLDIPKMPTMRLSSKEEQELMDLANKCLDSADWKEVTFSEEEWEKIRKGAISSENEGFVQNEEGDF